MNITCNSKSTNGIFSKLMIVFQNIEMYIINKIRYIPVDEIESINIINFDKRIDFAINPYRWIYVQDNKEPDLIIDCIGAPVYKDMIPTNELIRLKTIISKLSINNEIIEKFNDIKNNLFIDKKYLGVHVRLTDMNVFHSNLYGIKTTNDYIEMIDKVMKNNKYDKIFIASDNNESLKKLENRYGDLIVYYDNFLRVEGEKDDLYTMVIKNFSNKKLWVDSFIEMLLLAQCDGLIHRVSNLDNVAKIYSNNIKETYII